MTVAPQLNRDLTFEERATWGTCPVCRRAHGEPCDPDQGFHLGLNARGEIPKGGAHLARLTAGPRAIQILPVR
jgi:hypothetical protein